MEAAMIAYILKDLDIEVDVREIYSPIVTKIWH